MKMIENVTAAVTYDPKSTIIKSRLNTGVPRYLQHADRLSIGGKEIHVNDERLEGLT